jgi:hypothetical protein
MFFLLGNSITEAVFTSAAEKKWRRYGTSYHCPSHPWETSEPRIAPRDRFSLYLSIFPLFISLSLSFILSFPSSA